MPPPSHSPRPAPTTALLVLLALLACGDDRAPVSGARGFLECAADAGLDVPLRCGGEADVKQTILEVNGNGVALADLDGDADLDVVLVDGSTRARWLDGERVAHHVLRNDGTRDGVPRFTDVSADAALTMAGWPTGVAVADFDEDGRPDLAIGGLGEDAVFLNRTDAGGPIRMQSRALPGRSSPLDWTTSLAAADADGDGHLDLYLCRYLTIDPAAPPIGHVGDVPCRFEGLDVMCGPHGLPPQPDVLLRGRGDGTFEDVTAAAGLDRVPPSFGLGVLFADLDDDARPDLYVANDSVDNFVLHNVGDGAFESRGALSGAATDGAGAAQAGMGIAAGDLDLDGDLDLVVTNFSGETNALYRNDGALMFRDVASRSGLGRASLTRLGWGVHLADLDADGRLELIVSNGHVYPQADAAPSLGGYAQPIDWLAEGEDGRLAPRVFDDGRRHRGRATALGDLDGDGDLDLLATTLDGRTRLYLNRADVPERQMLVSLVDRGSPVPAATLRLEFDDGTVQLAQTLSATGFQAASDPRLHFARRAAIVRASVRWPHGPAEALDPATLAWGRHHVVRRGAGVVRSQPLELVR